MTDRLERIETRFHANAPCHKIDVAWMIGHIDELRRAAHADQAVIQRLRREVDESRNEAGHARDELADYVRRVKNRRTP